MRTARQDSVFGVIVSAFAAFAITALATHSAHAGEPQIKTGAKWFVHVDGAACAQQRDVFEREIGLACDAMRTCRIVPRAEAELEAMLTCDATSWRLETRTVEGESLLSIDLMGSTPEDRMREAAIEIARDVAPERTLAAESIGNTLETNSDRPPRVAPTAAPPKLTVTASGLVSNGSTSSEGHAEAMGFGARATAGYRVATQTNALVSLLGAGGGSEITAFRRVRGTAGVGFGAPYTSFPIGMTFDAGIDGKQKYTRQTILGQTLLEPASQTSIVFESTIVAQIPIDPVRPYCAGTVAFLSSAPNVLTSIDVGIAIPLF